MEYVVEIGDNGRIQLPRPLREDLDWGAGDKLLLRRSGQGLEVERMPRGAPDYPRGLRPEGPIPIPEEDPGDR